MVKRPLSQLNNANMQGPFFKEVISFNTGVKPGTLRTASEG